MGFFLLSSVPASVTILCILALSSPIQCGSTILHPESRIIGEIATKVEFPHQVLMRVQSGGAVEFCGGSILNADYILLAGHCVANLNPLNIFFGVGQHNTELLESTDFYTGAEVIIHPCYDQERKNEHGYELNDIAIVKLGQPLPLNEQNIKAIQIDQQNLANVDGTVTRAIGWGISNGSVLSTLQKASFKVITSLWTQIDGKLNPEGQICVNSKDTFVCDSDSGGPLLCDDGKGTIVVCGIASLVHKLDPKHTDCQGPAIFTRVYHYRNWIKSVLAEERNSNEGCINEPYIPKSTTTTEHKPEPESESTLKPKPEPEPETTLKPKPEPETDTTSEYEDSSRGFLSYRPSRFVCGFCFILTFLSICLGKEILLNL